MLKIQTCLQDRAIEANLGSDLAAAVGRLKAAPILHPLLEEARDNAFASIQNAGSNLMTLIIGPPKVGTTVLVKKGLTERINNFYTGKVNPEDSPVLYLSLVPSGAGEFNWKNLDFQILQDLNPSLAAATTTAKPPITIPSYDRAGPLFRDAAKDALVRRGKKVLILDHAHNLILASGGPSLNEQFERLLAIGTASDIHVVLVANYSTYLTLKGSGRLASSTNIVHLPRYNWAVPDEQEQFRTVLKTFQKKRILAEKSKPSNGARPAISFELEDEALNIYKATFGLVGLTKELLVNTLARAEAKGCFELTQRNFQRHMDKRAHLLPLARELGSAELELARQKNDLELEQWLFAGRPFSAEGSEPTRKGGDFQRGLGRDQTGIPEECR